jgi:hypothetical protein
MWSPESPPSGGIAESVRVIPNFFGRALHSAVHEYILYIMPHRLLLRIDVDSQSSVEHRSWHNKESASET